MAQFCGIREQLKEKMFFAGLELLKEIGMTQMSVEKITVAAGIINNNDSVYQYVTPEDEKKLADAAPDKVNTDIDEETETLKRLFTMFEGVREDADHAFISTPCSFSVRIILLGK